MDCCELGVCLGENEGFGSYDVYEIGKRNVVKIRFFEKYNFEWIF